MCIQQSDRTYHRFTMRRRLCGALLRRMPKMFVCLKCVVWLHECSNTLSLSFSVAVEEAESTECASGWDSTVQTGMISLVWCPARYIQPPAPSETTRCITISNINSTWPAALHTEGGRKGGKEGEFFIRHKRMASRCMLDWRLRGASCLNVKALCRTQNVISHDLTSLITPPLWRGKFLSGKIRAGCFRSCIFLNIRCCFSTYYLRSPFHYSSVFKRGDVSVRIWMGRERENITTASIKLLF